MRTVKRGLKNKAFFLYQTFFINRESTTIFIRIVENFGFFLQKGYYYYDLILRIAQTLRGGGSNILKWNLQNVPTYITK